MTTKDEKYIVFSRAEFAGWLTCLQNGDDIADIDHPAVLDDAVVIRTQDVFAGPALHAYASNIWNVAQAYRACGLQHLPDQLLSVADYFHERAVEADKIAMDNEEPRYPT